MRAGSRSYCAWAGIAPVHAKTLPAQEVRALLVARKQLLDKLIAIEFSIRGILHPGRATALGRLITGCI
jgi:hypothetical protein